MTEDLALSRLSNKLRSTHDQFIEEFFITYLKCYDTTDKEKLRKILESGTLEITTFTPDKDHLIRTQVRWMPRNENYHEETIHAEEVR